MRHFRPSLRQAGVTEQQWRIMRCIEGTKGLEAKTIARECFILSPSLSRILNSLETSGIITRRQNDNDMRSQKIQLTPKGRRLFDRHAKESAAIYEKIESRLGKKNLASLIATLKEVEQALSED